MMNHWNGFTIVSGQAGDCPPEFAPRIAVMGDIMIDVDVRCSCPRICQEGPWPVFAIERVERRLGGAGNVAAMTHALGAHTLLMGLVGQDDSEPLPGLEPFAIGWQHAPGRTTTKTRFWVDGRLTGPRVDLDLAASPQRIDSWMQGLVAWEPTAIIVADHGKGVVTTELMQALGKLHTPIYVDPILTTPLPFAPAATAGGRHELSLAAHQAECVIEKRGSNGLVWTMGANHGSLPSACTNVIDPLGAGDQFIATLAYERSLGATWQRAIELANLAAGLQCERCGCAPITLLELRDVRPKARTLDRGRVLV